MKVNYIFDEVNTLKRAEYDINIWSQDNYVYVTFYPLRYPGEAKYPSEDIKGFPIVDTSEFYSLKIFRKSRGPKRRKALEFLKEIVNSDHVHTPELYPSELWDDRDGMDWWSSESELLLAPKLITDFMSELPRRDTNAV